jgi:hypothetical protein
LDAERVADHAQIAVRRPEEGELLVWLFNGDAEVHNENAKRVTRGA